MRKIADCRDYPSESRCSLTIAGEEDEVVRAVAEHAASVHGHEDTPGLREELRKMLKDDVNGTGHRYGTVMVGRLSGSADQLQAEVDAWIRGRQVPGYLANETLITDDRRTVVSAVFFESEAAYRALANDPQQAEWWASRMAPLHEGEPTWHDGHWRARQEKTAAVPQQAGSPVTT
jgi:predicted small metal-binding protein